MSTRASSRAIPIFHSRNQYQGYSHQVDTGAIQQDAVLQCRALHNAPLADAGVGTHERILDHRARGDDHGAANLAASHERSFCQLHAPYDATGVVHRGAHVTPNHP